MFLILAVKEVPAIPRIVKGKINAYAPLTIRVLAGARQTSQNKRKIEANGNGAYRICEKNVNDKEENETTQEKFYKYDDELAESIKNIEKHLEKYKKFNWINCREDELQEARFYANKLIKLSEKIRNEIGM